MSANLTPPPFAIVIDTDTYAGNFERPMCAFITGRVGECGVGEEQAKQTRLELPEFAKDWFDNSIISVPDDHGCSRPASIWPTPGWFNDGLGSHWEEGSDPNEVKERYEASVRETYGKEGYQKGWLVNLDILEGRIPYGGMPLTCTVEACHREIDRLEARITEAIARGPGKFPACQSVAIFCDAKPTKEIWGVIRERAQAFVLNPPEYSYVGKTTGFRLAKLNLKVTELAVPK